MKQDNINYLMVGLFVLGMLAMLMLVLYRITGIGIDADHYYVSYGSITGITEGSVVTYGGYALGQVDSVEPQRAEGKTRYRLRLALRKGWQIPTDSVARIITPGLLSDNLVDIREGKSDRYLQPGAELTGEEEVGIVAMLNSMAYQIQDISDKGIKPLIARIDHHVETIGADLGEQIPAMTRAMNELLGRLNESATRVSAMLSKESEQRFSNIIANTDTFTRELLDLSAGFKHAGRQLDALLQESSGMVLDNKQDIRTSVEALRNTMDSVTQNINTILYNLETTSRNMNEFSRQLRENPGILLHGTPPQEQAR